MATLQNKRILVVGGTAGIGYGVAEACLKSLASEVTVVSSTSERVSKAVEQLTAGNFGPGKVRGDTIDARDQPKLKEYILNFGEVDHVVWTSGEAFKTGMQAQDLDVVKGLFDVRFWGPVIIAKHAKFRPGGSLTLTAGVALFKPIPSMSLVGGVAGALDAITRGFAIDLAPVRVNIVCPGVVETELIRKMVDAGDPLTAVLDTMFQRMPIKRMGQPQEIAEAYLYLMKCTYVTGQTLIVDGGYVLS